jgi:hypothetical protein
MVSIAVYLMTIHRKGPKMATQLTCGTRNGAKRRQTVSIDVLTCEYREKFGPTKGCLTTHCAQSVVRLLI